METQQQKAGKKDGQSNFNEQQYNATHYDSRVVASLVDTVNIFQDWLAQHGLKHKISIDLNYHHPYLFLHNASGEDSFHLNGDCMVDSLTARASDLDSTIQQIMVDGFEKFCKKYLAEYKEFVENLEEAENGQ